MEKITIVVCSKKSRYENESFIQMIETTCGCAYDLHYIENTDGISLTQIYSQEMEKSETDIMIFMHDDIDFCKKNWGAELIRLFNDNPKFGIIGVAGSAEFDSKGAWWTYERKYGQVLHRHNGKIWLSQYSSLIEKDLEEVAVVDGLFIGVNKNRIKYNFNPQIEGFHMYDIDFCLGNFIQSESKIGVTTKIRVAHNSIGGMNEQWGENLQIVNMKYNKYYPIKV